MPAVSCTAVGFLLCCRFGAVSGYGVRWLGSLPCWLWLLFGRAGGGCLLLGLGCGACPAVVLLVLAGWCCCCLLSAGVLSSDDVCGSCRVLVLRCWFRLVRCCCGLWGCGCCLAVLLSCCRLLAVGCCCGCGAGLLVRWWCCGGCFASVGLWLACGCFLLAVLLSCCAVLAVAGGGASVLLLVASAGGGVRCGASVLWCSLAAGCWLLLFSFSFFIFDFSILRFIFKI